MQKNLTTQKRNTKATTKKRPNVSHFHGDEAKKNPDGRLKTTEFFKIPKWLQHSRSFFWYNLIKYLSYIYCTISAPNQEVSSSFFVRTSIQKWFHLIVGFFEWILIASQSSRRWMKQCETAMPQYPKPHQGHNTLHEKLNEQQKETANFQSLTLTLYTEDCKVCSGSKIRLDIQTDVHSWFF